MYYFMQNAECKMPNTSKTKQNTYTQGPDCINRHIHWESHTSMHWKNNVHIIQIKNKQVAARSKRDGSIRPVRDRVR